MRFVGRDRELKKLNELYQEEEFSVCCYLWKTAGWKNDVDQ